MGHDGARNKQLNQLQAVQMGNLEPEALSFSGIAGLEDGLRNDPKKADRDRVDLLLQLQAVQRYLAVLEEQLAALAQEIYRLNKLRQEKLALTQQAFDQMHEAEDLIDDIADGVSPEERQRLIELLGDCDKDASADELIILLEMQIQKQFELGKSLTSEVDELEKRIAEKQREHDDLQAVRDQIAQSRSLEETSALIERYEIEKPEQISSMETHIENRDTTPNFDFPDFN